jgi:hypothetical protein
MVGAEMCDIALSLLGWVLAGRSILSSGSRASLYTPDHA